jgi:murein DD-endopeptidase MepM/ murein hydrolase activator NlpD
VDSSHWTELVTIENEVAAEQRQLALVEDRITNIAASSAQDVEPPLRGSGADGRLAGAAVLTQLLIVHQQLVDTYQSSLQREYQFYVAAAQTPTLRAAVVAAAAASPPANAVVAYDLQEVSTQLQQEQAIAAAQAAATTVAKAQILSSRNSPRFTSPVGGVVSQGFGSTEFALEPSLTYHGVFYTHFHTGIDIANTLDTPVGASAPGRVILATTSRDAAGNLVGYGNYVVIDQGGGYLSLYGHLDRVMVIAGQLVQRGQEIGLLGSTGWSTGPHLHFEIRHQADLVDPASLLGSAIRR